MEAKKETTKAKVTKAEETKKAYVAMNATTMTIIALMSVLLVMIKETMKAVETKAEETKKAYVAMNATTMTITALMSVLLAIEYGEDCLDKEI